MYKFKSNAKCLILQNIAHPPSAAMVTIPLTPEYLWNHQLEIKEEQENESSAPPGTDSGFTIWKRGPATWLICLKCSCYLLFPTFQRSAHLWCRQSLSTSFNGIWSQSFCPEDIEYETVSHVPLGPEQCSSPGWMSRSRSYVVPAPNTHVLVNKCVSVSCGVL